MTNNQNNLANGEEESSDQVVNMANNKENLMNGGEEESNVQSVGFPCDQCPKTYKARDCLNRHVKAEHSGKRFPSGTCGKEFKYVSDKSRHEKTCNPGGKAFDYDICGKRCATEGGLRRHQEIHQGPSKPPPTKSNPPAKKKPPKRKMEEPDSNLSRVSKRARTSPKEFRCRRCPEVFENRREFYDHGMRHHYQVGGGLQPVPWGENPAPWESEDGTVDEAMREVFETNEPIILEEHRPGSVVSTYNFPIGNDITIRHLMRAAEEIYRREEHASRLNLVFGVILQNRETGAYRYFRPYINSAVLESPIYISKREDLRKLFLLRHCPDTKWIPVLITNVVFSVYSTHYPLGKGRLPNYLVNHQAIVPLVKNRNNDKPYDDHLCAFRCLALHRNYDVKSLEGAVQGYFHQWSVDDISTFQGVCYDEFPKFEDIFKVNLEVYSLEENGESRSVYRSRCRYEKTMYLNLYENHLSYIKNFEGYAKKFQCQTCDRHFYRSNDLFTHQRSSSNQTKYVFPGGFFKSAQTIFKKLEEQDIDVPEDQRSFPWFIVYDFEAMLQKMSENSTENLSWTQKHVPISVSICSNVPRHLDPQCIVNSNVDELVKDMVECMNDIQTTLTELATEKWGWVLKELDKKANKCLDYGERAGNNEKDDDSEYDSEEEEEKEDFGEEQNKKAIQNLYGQMMGYMKQVPFHLI